jgi:hypothetical protein
MRRVERDWRRERDHVHGKDEHPGPERIDRGPRSVPRRSVGVPLTGWWRRGCGARFGCAAVRRDIAARPGNIGHRGRSRLRIPRQQRPAPNGMGCCLGSVVSVSHNKEDPARDASPYRPTFCYERAHGSKLKNAMLVIRLNCRMWDNGCQKLDYCRLGRVGLGLVGRVWWG